MLMFSNRRTDFILSPYAKVPVFLTDYENSSIIQIFANGNQISPDTTEFTIPRSNVKRGDGNSCLDATFVIAGEILSLGI